MKSRIVCLLTCLASIGLAVANGHASQTTVPEGFQSFWATELTRLQGWPANPQRQKDEIVFTSASLRSCRIRYQMPSERGVLPPVLYLLDRQDAGAYRPRNTHGWAVFDAGAMMTMETSPNPEQQPFTQAVLAAARALDLLLGTRAGGIVRAGLVGEGNGAAVAIALAAVRPNDVAFVAAHQPVNSALYPNDPTQAVAARAAGRQAMQKFDAWMPQLERAAEYVDLLNFAPLVRAPTLVSLGEADTVATPAAVGALYEALGSNKELVTIPRGRHCQAADLREWQGLWQEWTRAALGHE